MNSDLYTAQEAEAARREEGWGSLTWLANRQIGNAAGLTLGRVVIKRGQSNPRHAHLTCEEALYLLCGRLTHTIGDKAVVLEAGDTLTIPAGVFHNAVSIGEEDADMIVVYSSGERDFVLET
jgi:quercetin dioxygenase-like cupin family protein